MNETVIRRASPEDADALLALWRASDATASPTDTRDDVLAAIANPACIVLVAESNDTICGSIIGTFDGWRGNMYRLAVHPDHRRQGIARRLLSEVEAMLTERGARRITALVESDHPWAVGFWSAVGYHLDERMSRYVRNL